MPEHDDASEYSFEASEERLRQKRYKQGWWAILIGVGALAMCVLEGYTSWHRTPVLDVRLGLLGAFGIIGGIAALVIYRRRPLPKATLHKR